MTLWKTIAELGVAIVLLLVGSGMVTDALNGGPAWKWLGVLVLWSNINWIQSAWKRL